MSTGFAGRIVIVSGLAEGLVTLTPEVVKALHEEGCVLLVDDVKREAHVTATDEYVKRIQLGYQVDNAPPSAKWDDGGKPWGKRNRRKFGGIRTK